MQSDQLGAMLDQAAFSKAPGTMSKESSEAMLSAKSTGDGEEEGDPSMRGVNIVET